MASRRPCQQALFLKSLAILALVSATGSGFAASRAGSPTAAARIVAKVDDAKVVTLAGHVHPLASAKYDQGVVPDSMAMDHIFLQLKRTPGQDQALDRAIAERQNPHSSRYHQWLTAEEMGKNFGPSEQDVARISDWLATQGIRVNSVSKNGMTIDISATAGQVRQAFHTQIHQYSANGKQGVANATDPTIPAALAPVVAGFVSLNSFKPKSAMIKRGSNFSFPCAGCPDGFDGVEQYDEAPADLATIYNVAPLYKAKNPITGKGQTVVVLERTDIKSDDVTTFRKAFGLSGYSGGFSQVHPGAGCTDPGVNADEGEAALDAEWAGAVAPDADVVLASCADTATNFGPFIAALGLLDSPEPPPIMSLSYSGCEAGQGPTGNAFIYALWQQAAAEGVSVFVSTGDGAAAGCDDPGLASPNWALAGIAANGLASTPYNVAVGATDFLDTFLDQNSTYWSTTNSATGKSAKSYIPEIPWNDSCGSDVLYFYYGISDGLTFCNGAIGSNFLNIIGGSGAPSFVYAKPYWQKNVIGVPNDGVRDLPDVSLFGSNAFWNHAVLFCMSDAAEGGAPCDYTNGTDTLFNSAGGTSFAAPQVASIQALINQKAGGPQGNPDPIYYDLSRLERGGKASPNAANLASCNSGLGNDAGPSCMFYDVTAGTNTVPCYGTNNCYNSSPAGYGLLSTSDKELREAYSTAVGWDFTTGLGTLNVNNIVNNWP